MHQKQKDIQKRFEGFLQTPNLWKKNTVFGLHQFELSNKISKISIEINEKLRLGKYIEYFVFYQLRQQNYNLLLQNTQIQSDKITIGELDCIASKNAQLIHLEIIYKFYLYDVTLGATEIEHCIGPNRKDSLVEKLNKLKAKQLPLIYSKACKPYLDQINISSTYITQNVCFKAQLFLPFDTEHELHLLNKGCVSGYYIHFSKLHVFKGCKFFVPIKKDWIVVPHLHVNWLTFDDFNEVAKNYYQKKYSPLCWVKQQNGEIIKLFVVWW